MIVDPVLGPLKSRIDLRQAIGATIELWIETYLAAVERAYELEPRTLPAPRGYLFKDDERLDKRPEKQTPTIVILSPGSKKKPSREGDGMYRASWQVNVAAVVKSVSEIDAIDLAEYYTVALRQLLIHKGSLGGFAMGSAWEGERSDPIRPDGKRTQAIGINVFTFTVDRVAQKGAGLLAPLEDPYEPPVPVTAKEVDVELEPEEIA